MGQMSKQWEREGHATKLAETVMQAHGGLNLHSNFSKENPIHIKMSYYEATSEQPKPSLTSQCQLLLSIMKYQIEHSGKCSLSFGVASSFRM